MVLLVTWPGLISYGLYLQKFEAGFQFLNQKLKSGHSSESTDLAQWPVKMSSPVDVIEIKSDKIDGKYWKQSTVCLLEGRRVHSDTYTQGGSARELHPLSLNPLCGVFLPGSLWPVTLLCWALSLCWVYLTVFPSVHAHLIAKPGSSEEDYG